MPCWPLLVAHMAEGRSWGSGFNPGALLVILMGVVLVMVGAVLGSGLGASCSCCCCCSCSSCSFGRTSQVRHWPA